MRIPFGPRLPNIEEEALLTMLGFNLSSIEKERENYYLNTPNSRRINCKKSTPDLDKGYYEIYYNGLQVINITEKSARYDSWVSFRINESSVAEALAKNSVLPEESLPEVVEFAPTKFQEKVKHNILELMLMMGMGASMGYAKHLGSRVAYFKKLRDENPKEYDDFLDTDSGFKEFAKNITTPPSPMFFSRFSDLERSSGYTEDERSDFKSC